MIDRLEWTISVILRGFSVGRSGRSAKTARVDDGGYHLRRRAGVGEDDYFGERAHSTVVVVLKRWSF